MGSEGTRLQAVDAGADEVIEDAGKEQRQQVDQSGGRVEGEACSGEPVVDPPCRPQEPVAKEPDREEDEYEFVGIEGQAAKIHDNPAARRGLADSKWSIGRRWLPNRGRRREAANDRRPDIDTGLVVALIEVCSLFVDQSHIEDGYVRRGRDRQLASYPIVVDGADSHRTRVHARQDLGVLQVECGAGIGDRFPVAKLDHQPLATARASNHVHRARLVGGDGNVALLDPMPGEGGILLKVDAARFRIERNGRYIFTPPPLDGASRFEVLGSRDETEEVAFQMGHRATTVRNPHESRLDPPLPDSLCHKAEPLPDW